MKSFDQFKDRLGLSFNYSMNLAMQPDVAFEFESTEDLRNFEQLMPKLTDEEGNRILQPSYKPVGQTLNLQLARSVKAAETNTLVFNGAVFNIDEFGLEIISRDIGTGYHQPEGIWTWRDGSTVLNQSRQRVDTRQFAPSMLRHFGIKAPEYMQEPIAGETQGSKPTVQEIVTS